MQASLLPNPEIEVEVEEAGGTGERSGFDSAQTTIALGQLIELADKPRKRTKLASLEKQLAGWDYEAKRLDVLTESTKAYIEVLGAQQQVKLAEQLMEISEKLVASVDHRVKAGKDSPVEKTKSEIVLARASIQNRKARQNLEFTRKQLAAAWGSKAVTFDSVTGRLDVVYPLPPIDTLLELTAQNPDVARWAVEIDRRKADLELEKANSITDPAVFGGIQRFNDTDDNAVVFGLSIPLPVTNRNQGNILAASHNLAKVREQQRQAETLIYTNLNNSYTTLSNAYTEATDMKNKVLQGAKESFNATVEAYREGKVDYLALLDAQRTLFEAEAQYIDALVSYHKAKADIERLIGQEITVKKF